MGIMDEVHAVADKEIGTGLMWKCKEQLDRFYRRHQIYPVPEYGLGIPYQAEDGALEGDTVGPTVYQAGAAVGTNHTEFNGTVHFLVGDKGININ